MDENITHQLTHQWDLWTHDLDSTDWSLSGYQKIFTFHSIEDCWIMINQISDWNLGMYYIMKSGYLPIWEDEKNINGGAWTFKCLKTTADKIWIDMLCALVGSTLVNDPDFLTGLSISPKAKFATIRVWTSHIDSQQYQYLNTALINFHEARFMSNRETLKNS